MSKTPKPTPGQSSEDYWRERETRQRAANIHDEARFAARINDIFQSTQDSIQQEIESFYQRYAKKEGIDIAEARRRVSKIDMEKYERLAAQYVKAAHEGGREAAFSDIANEQMRLYNATMRINRLEMLKARCGIRAMEGYRLADQLINDALEERTYSEYYRLAGILGNTVQFNENMVRSIVNASYQNATWSQRLWNNQALLSERIGAHIAQGILTGKGSDVLARNIQKLTGQSTYVCQRLMRTELRRVQTAAAEQSMKDNGVTEYKFMVANGVNPCDECLSMDGQVFKLSEMAVGKNAPPVHPNCHCCTAPYVDEEKWQKWLDGPAQAGVPWEEFEVDTIDYMGSANVKEKMQTPFGKLTLKQFKKYEHDIWTEDNSRETRRTAKVIDDLVRSAKELMPTGASVPRIVIVTKDRLGKGRYGGYDYKTDTIYYPNAYESIESIRRILESGYFGGTSPETLVLHETGHKDHWDQARRLYKENPKKYNSLEDAKHYLDDARRYALSQKVYEDPSFIIRNVSVNAHNGLERKGTINEFQADYYVRKCQDNTPDELRNFLEGIDHDALTK